MHAQIITQEEISTALNATSPVNKTPKGLKKKSCRSKSPATTSEIEISSDSDDESDEGSVEERLIQ